MFTSLHTTLPKRREHPASNEYFLRALLWSNDVQRCCCHVGFDVPFAPQNSDAFHYLRGLLAKTNSLGSAGSDRFSTYLDFHYPELWGQTTSTGYYVGKTPPKYSIFYIVESVNYLFTVFSYIRGSKVQCPTLKTIQKLSWKWLTTYQPKKTR